jgi:hypothetical protein
MGPSKLICKERRHLRPLIGKVACDTDVAGVRTALHTSLLLLASLLIFLIPDAPGMSAVGSVPSLANTPHVATVACSVMFLLCLLLLTSLLLQTTLLLLASQLLLLVSDAPGMSAVVGVPSLAITPHVATVACSVMFLVCLLLLTYLLLLTTLLLLTSLLKLLSVKIRELPLLLASNAYCCWRPFRCNTTGLGLYWSLRIESALHL